MKSKIINLIALFSVLLIITFCFSSCVHETNTDEIETGYTTNIGPYVRTAAGHDAIIYEGDDGTVHLVFLTHRTDENSFDEFETGDTIFIKFVLLCSEGELEYIEVFDCYEKGDPVEIPEEYIEKLNSLDAAWAEFISQ